MLFFPIRTDRRLKRTPWVNYCLIALNVLIYLMTYHQVVQPMGGTVGRFYLWPNEPELVQFISYQFLHADFAHLAGNMIFLYVFGNSVEDRLGRVGYLAFYLAGGVAAGIGHALIDTAPVLGASGAVAAVTGAFLALFPLTDVTIFYWFFLIVDTFLISSIVLILFRVMLDVYYFIQGVGNTAYLAHLAGYGFGFVVGMGLLWTRLLAREPYDLLALIEQRRRRAEFRRLTEQGFQPWEGGTATAPDGSKQATPLTPEQEQVMEQRSQISEALTEGRAEDAARLYRELRTSDPSQVMGQDAQLAIANQLMSEANYTDSAAAYELFLQQYQRYGQIASIQLILGLIYGRYLDQPERARELLKQAKPRLTGGDAELAQTVLDELPDPSAAS